MCRHPLVVHRAMPCSPGNCRSHLKAGIITHSTWPDAPMRSPRYPVGSAIMATGPSRRERSVIPRKATDAIISTVDIYPTLVELAALPMPGHLDGSSFMPTLKDPSARTSGSALGFWRNEVTLRTDRYRLIGSRLYETGKDPSEENDLADQHPEIVEQLEEQRDALFKARKAGN